jgi:WXXGXW repeat (2 copies)
MKRMSLLVVLALTALSPNLASAQFRAVPGVRVMTAPPPPRHELAPPAPSPRHQWIGGYWGSRGGAHVWFAGHWALPPAPGYLWEPARWEEVDGAWTVYDGHWRPMDVPDPVQAYQPPPPPVEEVVTEVPPPAPIEEVRPPVPFDGAMWIPGFWHFNGARHVWVAGRWSARPAGYHWEQHRWEPRPDGRWAQRPGHWSSEPEHRRDEHR